MTTAMLPSSAQLLEFNPRAEEIILGIATQWQGQQPAKVVRESLDVLMEAVAILCVHFFQNKPSATATSESILRSDLYANAVGYCDRLAQTWSKSLDDDDRMGCLGVVSEALERTWVERNSPRQLVRHEFAKAYLVCLALRNELRGRPLFDRAARYEVIAEDPSFSELTAASKLEDVRRLAGRTHKATPR